jgi:osmotically-inducible protein OsmY
MKRIKTDDELRADVHAELSRIRTSEIGVIVKDGAVTLSGMVHTLGEKACAERAVKNIKGVRAIADDIEVKLPAEMRKADEHIAEQISRVLTWYSSLRNMDVRAEVDDGHVTLTGEVDFLYQKSLAAERVAELECVVGVSNQITIRERHAIDQNEVKRQIMAALRRHAAVEASGIQISVADGKVILEGVVDACCERDLLVMGAYGRSRLREILFGDVTEHILFATNLPVFMLHR